MATKKPETVAAEIGGWFKNIGAHAVTILHELGTFVLDAGQVKHLPFPAQHRDLVAVAEADAKAAEEKLAADAKAVAEAAVKDAAPIAATAVTTAVEKEL